MAVDARVRLLATVPLCLLALALALVAFNSHGEPSELAAKLAAKAKVKQTMGLQALVGIELACSRRQRHYCIVYKPNGRTPRHNKEVKMQRLDTCKVSLLLFTPKSTLPLIPLTLVRPTQCRSWCM